ncbi:MAG: AI-2E family transporter [Acidobacteriia bacterium]|nr:AI-2E family transporter [Terriglobia bacterium]
MLGIDRRTLQAAWTLFLFALVLLVIYNIGRTLIIFALALIFAHLLAPVVNFVERIFPASVPRVASLALVYIALIAALAATLVPIGSRISDEAATLAARLPDALKGDPLGNLPFPRWLEPFRVQVTSLLRDWFSDFGQQIGPRLAAAGTSLIRGIGSVLGAILIPILSFFFLKDGTHMHDAIVDSFDPRRRELVDNIFSDIHLLLAQYIRALVVLSLATFTFYSIFLAVIGGPYPVLLAGLAAVLEFIPAIGPLAGAVVIVMTVAVSGFGHLVLIVIFLAIYRIFQDYVLNPYLMSAGVELHPLLVLFGVLAGEQLLGVPGMFFSVPTMAALRLILIRLRHRRAA